MNYPQRMYSKTELGLLYFPDTTDGATARRHIMGWIKRCEPLWNELQRLGYQEHSQYFPPRQVFTIFEYLVNHQYSVPTIYQRVSRTSIFE